MPKGKDLLCYFILIAISFPIVFLKLGSFSIRVWDESMYAVNVYEMLHKKSFLLPYFNNAVDIVNTKPPLVLWIQMGFVKMFGFNEIALRLPSALATTGIILLVFGFLKKRFSVITGFIGALILITAQGLHTFHSGRTADLDAVTTFFITAANIVFLNIVIDKKLTNLRIVLYFLFAVLAFWSKSLLSLLFIPSMLILLITDKELIMKFIKNKVAWAGILILLFSAIFYILIRNHYQAGYVERFVARDMGRVVTDIENFNEPFMFYIWNFNSSRFTYWLMPALIAIFCSVVMIFRNGLKTERFAFALALMIISYWLIISFTQTKAGWYDLPLYPLLAMIIAYYVWQFMHQYNVSFKIQLLALSLFIIPYRDIFGINQSNSYGAYGNMNESQERYIHSMILHKQSLDGYVAFHEGFFGSLLYYKYRLKDKGQNFRIETNASFSAGEKIIVSQPELKKQLEQKYRYNIIDHNEYVTVYSIIGSSGDNPK